MRRPRPGDDTGAAAVEFALVGIFLLIPILFGIMQYGMFFYQASAAEHAAHEGSRLAAVGIADCDDWAEEVAKRGQPGNIQTVEARFSDTDGVMGLDRGDTVEVTVLWDPFIDWDFPFVPSIGSAAVGESASTRVERTGGATPVNCSWNAP